VFPMTCRMHDSLGDPQHSSAIWKRPAGSKCVGDGCSLHCLGQGLRNGACVCIARARSGRKQLAFQAVRLETDRTAWLRML
jgi:hypothetical protein